MQLNVTAVEETASNATRVVARFEYYRGGKTWRSNLVGQGLDRRDAVEDLADKAKLFVGNLIKGILNEADPVEVPKAQEPPVKSETGGQDLNQPDQKDIPMPPTDTAHPTSEPDNQDQTPSAMLNDSSISTEKPDGTTQESVSSDEDEF